MAWVAQVSLPEARCSELEGIILAYFGASEITPEILQRAENIEAKKAVDGW